jgi:uncharacterized membrane protein
VSLTSPGHGGKPSTVPSTISLVLNAVILIAGFFLWLILVCEVSRPNKFKLALLYTAAARERHGLSSIPSHHW